MEKEKIYIYCRTSTLRQDMQRQIRNGKELHPDGIVIEEKYTGRTQERPKWQRLLRQLETDISKGYKVRVVFDSVSRMSRNKEEGVKQYFELYEKGVELEFIKEHTIDTEIYRETIQHKIDEVEDEVANVYIRATNEVMRLLAKRQIERAFEDSASEIKELSQRTKEGLETARINGKTLGHRKGQKNKESAKKLKAKELITKYKGTLPACEIQSIAGISKDTYYRYCRELGL